MSSASWQAQGHLGRVQSGVRLSSIVLDYRIRCKEIELRRTQLGLTPDSQPAQAAPARTQSGVARTVSQTA